MDRIAAFVNAGYLFAAGAQLISGRTRPRGELHLDVDALLDEIERLAREVSGLPLLRIYWYDGTATGPTPQHLRLAFKPRVKLRLGFVNTFGEQKGVDALFNADLITLARNRAIADALLLTGDEDVRVSVLQAQEFGVRVHLLGIAPCRANQAQLLVQEADTVHEWGLDTVARFLSHQPRTEGHPDAESAPEHLPAAAEDSADAAERRQQLQQVAAELARNVLSGDIEVVLRYYEQHRELPSEIDRPLLGTAKKTLRALLNLEEKTFLRVQYVEALRQRLASAESPAPANTDPQSAPTGA
jgi:hypothetical protein